ncbi:MAG: ABC transporter permease [Candidatus Ornithomonoglobus sp.]
MKTKTQKEINTKSLDKKGWKYYLKRDWELYALLLIPFVLVILFKFLPLAGLSIAFMDYKPFMGFSGSTWVGMDVFKSVFTNKDFYSALKNTLLLNILDLILGFPAPVILAIFLNEIRCKWFKKTTQTIMYLPHFLSWVIIAGLAQQLFYPSTGYINILITKLGGEAIPFLTEKWHWLASYVLIGVWQGMGWGTIIYLAAITGIDAELYEAATVDGAGRWRKIWSITLPCLKSTIIVMLIMSLGRIMGSSLERPLALTNTNVTDISNVIAMYVYRVGLQNMNYNIATAVGLFQSLVGVILVFIADRIAKLMGESGIV